MTIVRAAGGVAAALMTVAAVGVATTGSAHADDRSCRTWSKHGVAEGFGVLENLAFDGRGGVLLSEQATSGPGAIRRLTADGARSVAAADVDGPGGLLVSGHTAYFTTGNSAVAALSGRADGTIDALDLDTGVVRTVASGLTMPNGLAQLPGGDLVVSRDVGTGSMTRVAADGGATPYAPWLASTNGLAFDPGRGRLVVSTTFEPTTTIASVDAAARPGPATVLPGYGPANSADDLTVAPDGTVYVALNVAGRIEQVDLDTGRTCTIAEGLPLSSSVRFGAGPGWNPDSLYVTGFLGTLTELRRPAP